MFVKQMKRAFFCSSYYLPTYVCSVTEETESLFIAVFIHYGGLMNR